MARKATDAEIIQALLTGKSYEQTAKAVGISVRALYTRRKDPGFESAYAEAKSAVLQAAANRAASAMEIAVDALAELADDDEIPPGTRAAAAEGLLRQAVRLREAADFEARIARLEAVAAKEG